MENHFSANLLGYDSFKRVPNDRDATEIFSFEGDLHCPYCATLLLDSTIWDPEVSKWNLGVGNCPHLIFAFVVDGSWASPEFLLVRSDYAKAYVTKLVTSPKYQEWISNRKLHPLKGREIAEFGSGELIYSYDFEDSPSTGERVAQCGWHLPSITVPDILPEGTIIFIAGKSTTIHLAICPSVEDTVKLP
ncbi:MAG: hypothetical protein HQ507_06930 [Candidatus Marinimicrobia bacterium]|nr:hypothetical protein [Candidatus Neomarinimicrobiota bacterium]